MNICKIGIVEFYAAYFFKPHALVFKPKEFDNSEINAGQVDKKKKIHFQR